MLKKSLLLKLYSYNMHLGSVAFYNSRLNYYIFGKRFNFYLINLNKSFLLLKKVLFFLNKLSSNNGSLLFHYSNYSNLNLIYKCVLLSISKISNQQLITYNWVYGKIGNYFFSFHLLLKNITTSWLKRQSYLFNSDKKINSYVNNLEGEFNNFEHFEYIFLKRWKWKKWWTKSRKRSFKSFNNWYVKWIQSNSEVYKYWIYNTRSYKFTKFFKQLALNDINNVWKTKKMLTFKSIFLKLFYYIYLKKQDSFSINIYLNKKFDLDSDFIYKKFKTYWRFILYFKYFNNYYSLPDALFSIFPNQDDLPLKEYSTSGLVSIGLIDTDCKINSVNYPIISNDDSLMIVIFYFSLFSNLFLENKLNIYNIFNTNIKNKF